MPRGASPKREREYEELVGEFKGAGRYKGREKEVASRIVNKQRREHGETKSQRGGRSSSSSSAPSSGRRATTKAKSRRGTSSARRSANVPSSSASTLRSGTVTTDHDEIRRWAEERGAKP